MEQTGLVFCGLDLVETGLDTTIHNLDLAFKYIQELLGFVTIDFTVLYGKVTKKVIKLYGLVCGGTSLILGSFSTKPKVHVVSQFITLGVGLVGIKDDVRITTEEGAIGFLPNPLHLELLNAPYFNAYGFTSTHPSRLCLGRVKLSILVFLAAIVGDVRVLELGTSADFLHTRHDRK
jgi:hypothetical protein